MLKVWQVSTEDNSGGASRAAYRLHQALLQLQVDSMMRVLTHQTANSKVIAGRSARTLRQKVSARLEQKVWDFSTRNWHTDNPILHSFGRVSANIVDELNQSDATVLNLHWISKLLSIEDIGRIQKPMVWTLHDMWPLCGGEHHTANVIDARFRVGYTPHNRPLSERGPDLNRQAWETKQRSWQGKNFVMVAPSKWMAGCIEQSLLFADKKISTHVIPNPLDTELVWRPIPKTAARRLLGLDEQKIYVLAGSAGGMAHIKGEDLLPKLMAKIESIAPHTIELIVFGQAQPAAGSQWPCRVHWMGSVNDDSVMATIYSAVDVMIVPSRQDNLPNTAVEAHACATPVAAFDLGGLPDIVEHMKTGWLAPAFDLDHLASGILWMAQDRDRRLSLSENSRASALRRYSPAIIAKQYCEAYDEAIRYGL
jgi:glycosyltransferase involved in cell wall biosynthesis